MNIQAVDIQSEDIVIFYHIFTKMLSFFPRHTLSPEVRARGLKNLAKLVPPSAYVSRHVTFVITYNYPKLQK